MRKGNKEVIWASVVILAITGIVAVSRNIPIDPHSYNKGFAEYPVIAYLHFFPGGLFMVAGIMQFIPAIRRKAITLHRWSGRIFILSALTVSVTALAMVLMFPFGDFLEVYSTIFFGVFLFFAVLKAYAHIRKLEIQKHREWMLRAFSIGLGVSVIRIFVGLFSAFTDYKMKEVFGLCFLLAFVFSLSVAEWWIRKTRVNSA